jgi:multidrug resistance efflux pump
MFFRKIPFSFQEPVPSTAGKYGTSGTLHGWQPKGGSPRRALKIALALLVLGAGIAAILSGQGKIASNNAVISTNLVSLRAPIEGIVSGLPKRAGSMVTQGSLIAHIVNPLADDQRLIDLREHQTRVEAELEAADGNRAALSDLRNELARREAVHTKANSERLASLVDEAEKTLAALIVKQTQAQDDVDRRLPLEASDSIAKAEMHKFRSALEVARQDVAAQTARLAALRTEAEAAAQGVLTGAAGGSDRSYSAQRADEVAIELSTLDKTIATLAAEEKETKSRLEAEQKRIDLLRKADIVAPAAGMIWKLGAADGERLSTGDMAAEIVDCNAPFLLAAIPQDRFSDVEVGGVAQFRLSGERSERMGTVVSVTGHGDLGQGVHYAVLPLDEPSTVIATIALPPAADTASENGPQECLIGRSVRVLLPANGGGFVDQILRRVF